MTIIEAVKSGKRFRRQTWVEDQWCSLDEGLLFIEDSRTKTTSDRIHISEILADDWEVQEEKIEITKAQLANALNAINERRDGTWDFTELYQELGFKS